MNRADIPALRLINQHLTNPNFKTVEETVQWFGAVQAQDFLGSLWAVGQRMKDGSEEAVEQALIDRKIVRSWPMRGTLHFVHAKDLRWMLKLLTPRVFKRAASRYRELELTDELFKKSEIIFVQALLGGKQKTREELFALLEKNNISPDDQRGIHILCHLAMEGLLCFGARSGKQFTFTLLDEWIPAGKAFNPDNALAEITKRYFISHGPATIQDFVWWSGLTVADAKKGIDMVQTYLTRVVIDEHTYWFAHSKKVESATRRAWLLPAYDEYTVAYKDRSAIIESNHFIQAGNGLRPTIVMNGQIIGTWQRELKKHQVIIKPHFFQTSKESEYADFYNASAAYGKFLGRDIDLL
jgi:hypothetical protein